MFADFIQESSACLLALLPVARLEQFALMGILLSGLGTVACTHMVGNVLCLVVTFMWGAVLCLCQKAEFVAFLLPVVYIGAVIILFLFVVMMVDFRPQQGTEPHLRKTIRNMVWLMFCTVGASLFLWLFVGGAWPTSLAMDTTRQLPSHNILAIGKVLYTKYLAPFEWAAFILLVAMVAALWILNLHDNILVSKPHHKPRKTMRASEGVQWVDVPFREGVNKISQINL